MKMLRVYSEDRITITEYKKLIAIAKSSESIREDIMKEFPERCKEVICKKRKATIVYLDSKDASAHKYETKWE